MSIKEFKLEAIEDEAERAQRLRKEMYSFWFKELLISIVTAVLILIGAGCCLATLLNPGSPADDRKSAWSLMSILIAGVVAFLFGKAQK